MSRFPAWPRREEEAEGRAGDHDAARKAGVKPARAPHARRSQPRNRRRRRHRRALTLGADGADLDADALEFIAALDRFKKKHGRPFPSWSEVLTVLRELGYKRKV
jgi:FMN phosphatase YigB (HAD superfamily)